MMKWKIKNITALLAATALGLSACGGSAGGDGAKTAAETAVTEERTQETADPEEEKRIVELKLSGSLFGELTPEEIRAQAEANGFSECLIAEDGTVTYRMTAAHQKRYLQNYVRSLEQQLQSYVDGEDFVNSFQEITHNEDFTRFDILVPEDAYSEWDRMYDSVLFAAGAYYQLFSGIRAEDVDVTVNFLDHKTKKLLDTSSYQDTLPQEAGDGNRS